PGSSRRRARSAHGPLCRAELRAAVEKRTAMYSHEVISRLRSSPRTGTARVASVGPFVWALGLTSCLTDISSGMVNSLLPVYLVLHLRLSPLQFGAIDGIYNGLSVALVSVAAGL